MSDDVQAPPPAPQVPETLQAVPEPPQEPTVTTEPGTSSQGASAAPVAAEEAPVDHHGRPIPSQTEYGAVDMPDGSTVYTRNHPYPIDNSEQAVWEQTHSGDIARYGLKPGDQGYSPYSDPKVVDSHMAQHVEAEIYSFPERVKTDPNASVSPIWDGLTKVYQGELAQAIVTGGGNSTVEA